MVSLYEVYKNIISGLLIRVVITYINCLYGYSGWKNVAGFMTAGCGIYIFEVGTEKLWYLNVQIFALLSCCGYIQNDFYV